MIEMSDNWASAVGSDSREIRIKATINGTVYTGADELVSMTFNESLNSSSEISIGIAAMNMLVLKMYDQGVEVDDEIVAEIGIVEGSTVEWCPIGTFYVSEAKSNDHGITQDIIAYDSMVLLSGKYEPSASVTFPASASEVLDDIATQCGIAIGTITPWPFDVPIISKYTHGTYRDYIGWIAGLRGQNARFNRENELEFTFYGVDQSSYFEIPPERQYLNGLDENNFVVEIHSITAIGVGSTIISGSGYGIVFQNPYATQAILDDILETIDGLSFSPLQCKWRGNPALQCGDGIAVGRKDGTTAYALLMEQSITVTGGMVGIANCYGESETASALNQSPNETKMSRMYSSIQDDLSSAVSDLTEHITTVVQTSQSLVFEALDRYVQTGDLESYKTQISTQFAQTASDIQLTFSSLTEQINGVNDDLQSKYNERVAYIRFEDGNIILGREGNEITLVESNDRISFMQSGQEVAWFSNNQFHVTEAEFTTRARIGNFAFVPGENGNLSFKKVN